VNRRGTFIQSRARSVTGLLGWRKRAAPYRRDAKHRQVVCRDDFAHGAGGRVSARAPILIVGPEVCKLEQPLKSEATYAEAANGQNPRTRMADEAPGPWSAGQDGLNQESYE